MRVGYVAPYAFSNGCSGQQIAGVPEGATSPTSPYQGVQCPLANHFELTLRDVLQNVAA